jgi:hypothetical protein
VIYVTYAQQSVTVIAHCPAPLQKTNMKNLIRLPIAIVLFSSATMISCDNSAKNLEKAQDAVIEADIDLVKANQEYLSDMESYKKETDTRIETNKKDIADFKARVSKEKMEIQMTYAQKIAELEQRNIDLKKRLDDFSAEGEAQWETFKDEFTRDMDELGNAFKDFTIEEEEN